MKKETENEVTIPLAKVPFGWKFKLNGGAEWQALALTIRDGKVFRRCHRGRCDETWSGDDLATVTVRGEVGRQSLIEAEASFETFKGRYCK